MASTVPRFFTFDSCDVKQSEKRGNEPRVFIGDDDYFRMKDLANIIHAKYPDIIIDTARVGQIVPFYTGHQITEELCEHQDKYMVAFISYDMPERNGVGIIEDCRKVNADKSNRLIPTVGFSKSSKPKEACIKAGMTDFVTVPFDEDRIAQIMKNVISLQWAFQGKGLLKVEQCVIL